MGKEWGKKEMNKRREPSIKQESRTLHVIINLFVIEKSELKNGSEKKKRKGHIKHKSKEK